MNWDRIKNIGWVLFIFLFLKLKLNSSKPKPKPKSSLSLCLYTSQPPPAISSTIISLWLPLRTITYHLSWLTFGWSQRSQSPLTHQVFLSLRARPPLSLFGRLDDDDVLITTTTFHGWRWCCLGLVVLDMMMDFEAWYVTWEWWWGWRWCGFSDMKKLELLFGVLSIYLFGICLMGLWNGMLWKKFIFPILKFVFLLLGLLCWRCIWGFFFIGGFSLLKVWAL